MAVYQKTTSDGHVIVNFQPSDRPHLRTAFGLQNHVPAAVHRRHTSTRPARPREASAHVAPYSLPKHRRSTPVIRRFPQKKGLHRSGTLQSHRQRRNKQEPPPLSNPLGAAAVARGHGSAPSVPAHHAAAAACHRLPLPLLPPFAEVALYPRPLQDTSIRRSRGRRTPPPSPASVRSPPPLHQSSPQGTSTHRLCDYTTGRRHPIARFVFPAEESG